MPQVCLYLQLHQPWRLGTFSIFDLGSESSYFEDTTQHNKEIFRKVAKKSYLPMLTLLEKLLKAEPRFTFTLSLSGVFVDQALAFEPEVIEILKRLVKTGRVELLAETYYHSLAALYSPEEFEAQVKKQLKLMKELFDYTPRVFRNTELIYSNQVAELVSKMGFAGMLTEAVDRYLGGRPKTRVYYSYPATQSAPLPLLLKHAQLSDDVAFRFSDRNWDWYPLTVERYLEWVEVYGEDEIINLFMDFETFGEHQWEDTGIFEFWAEFVHRFSQKPWNTFVTPTQVFEAINLETSAKATQQISDTDRYNVPDPISWADVDRDLTAWRGNQLQLDTLEKIYALEEQLYKLKDKKILENWRRLQTSDHFYYMCTKWSADGDVHAYFSPYSSPYEAYRRFSVVLADLQGKINESALSRP
jgi:alpha-amylase